MRFSDLGGGNSVRTLTLGVMVAGFSYGCSDGTGPAVTSCGALSSPSQTSPSGPTLALSPGQICTLHGADAAALQVASSPTAAQYIVVIQSASRVPSARVSLRLEAKGPLPSASRVSNAVVTVSVSPPDLQARGEEIASQQELRFRANARAALRDAQPLRSPDGEHGRAPASLVRAQLALGDTMVFTNTVTADLEVECAGIHDVVTVVRALGSSFGIIEDVEAAGPVTASEYAALLDVLENSVFPVDTTYFGAPADLDNNGIVWLMFTPVVNRVTRRGSATRVSGFFNPSDLSSPASCAGSNEGEILYVVAADPSGRFSDPVLASFATTRAIGVAAHELEHLIAAQRRVTIGGGSFADLEDSWLSEGLAHSAETAVGLRVAGLPPGQNLGFGELTANSEAFDSFHFANFRRAGFHLLDTNGTMALGTASGADPGGVSSLEMRGFSWLLLRWLVDQYAPAGGGLLGGAAEELIYRDLVSGGPSRARGVANIERVAAGLGAPGEWSTLLALYGLAPAADDLAGATARSTQVTTFQLRDAYAGLNQQSSAEDPFKNSFPLVSSNVSMSESTNVGVDFDVLASTGRYFVFESPGPHPPISLTLKTSSGGAVPGSAEAQFVVLRTR